MGVLTGKRCLVVGAVSGIGRATAARLAADGCDLALVDVQNGDSVVAEAARFGARSRFWLCDVIDETAVASTVEGAVEWLGGLDVVIHVAGIVGARDTEVDALALDDWDAVLSVNLTGPFLVAKYATPYLERSRGVLVFTGSGAGIWNGHPSIAYAASKGGVHGLALTLEGPLRARGIRMYEVAPGAVDTPLLLTGANNARVEANRVAGRLLPPEKVASIMAFLASDEASAVRGTIRTW